MGLVVDRAMMTCSAVSVNVRRDAVRRDTAAARAACPTSAAADVECGAIHLDRSATVVPEHTSPTQTLPPPRHRLACASLPVALLALAGCAAVPIIPTPSPRSAAAIQPIRMRGPKGPLSQRETASILKRLSAEAPNASSFERHLAIEQFVAGTPLYTGNQVNILRDGPQTFDATFGAIRAAHHYLYLEYYILEDVTDHGQRLSDLLIERRRQGVLIDIIYDSIGSISTPADFFDRLRAADIHVRQFNPIHSLFELNDRDHRKILVADGTTAIIGGVNLSTDYESGHPGASAAASGGHAAEAQPAAQTQDGASRTRWHDTDLQIDGPAVIELKRLFEQHWREEGGAADELAPAGDAPVARGDQVVRIIGSEGGQLLPRYYATLLSAIRSASSRIWVEAAYFVPTFQERQALERAARRGVDVRLLLPARTDSKAALAVAQSYYSGLLRAGVRIYEREDGILHSKTAVMDGVWSIVGSSNFDHRSVLFNDEVDAVVIGDRTGRKLEQYFEQDLQHAHEVRLKNWRRRPLSQKIDEDFWRLWQQLL